MRLQNIGEAMIRPATNQDQDRIVTLVNSVLSEYGLRLDPEGTDADLNDIENNYLKSGGVFEVIEDGEGKLLGTAGLFPLNQETCELRKMYFVSQLRGKGMGKRMLERMTARARELGFKRVVLETAGVLKDAIRLYTRFGFVPIESQHLSNRCDQAFMLDLTATLD